MPTLRVVLDTNVLRAGIAYPGSVPGKIMGAWQHGALEGVLSAHILNELRRVLPRLVHRHGLAGNDIEDLVDILALQADVVEPSESDDPTLADADDQPVLGTLIAALQAARADYLITGDKALLALGGRYPIVTPAAFWAAHGGV